MAMTATATFRTTQELKSRVDSLAKETRRPSSFYFNLLLEEHLEDLEDIYLSEKVLQDIRNGKEKTYTAEEVFAEVGLWQLFFTDKANENISKHGLRFEDILPIFDDPLFWEQTDFANSTLEETRFLGVEKLNNFAVIVSCYTERNGRIRIINARITTSEEERWKLV